MAEYREAVTFCGDWIVSDGEKIIAEFSCKNVSEQEARKNAHQFAAASKMYEALKAARQFIKNGIEFGYILMPDKNTPDTAHKTLPQIEAALAKAEGREV